MKAPKFSYVRADSLDHALELLDKHGEDARILAGGQSLMPTLNMRLSQPEVLVDINRLNDLKGISLDGDTVVIGALTRHIDVMNSDIVAEHLPLIAEAMPHVAHVAIRNRGTIGGSIALSDPAAEMPACALALGATLIVQSSSGKREIPAEEFFHGLYETARVENELLVEIHYPSQKKDNVSVFMELARRHGDYAIAGVCAYGKVSGNMVEDMRLVYFASEDRPITARTPSPRLTAKPGATKRRTR